MSFHTKIHGGFVGAVRSVRCEWVRRQSGVSGFENDGETISPVVRRSLYSLFFLSMSLSSRMVRKWRDDLDDRWLGSTRVGLNDQSDAIVLLRCDLLAPTSAIFLLSLSLSLFYFPRPEIIWSENENGNHFPPFWLYFMVNRKCFNLTKFEVTTKHSLFRKIISEIILKSKQMEPKLHHNFTQNSIYSTTPYNTILFFK